MFLNKKNKKTQSNIVKYVYSLKTVSIYLK